MTSKQLKKEIDKADIEEAVCRQFGDVWEYYWAEFKRACCLALNRQRSRQSKRQRAKGKLSIQAVKETNDILEVITRYVALRGRGSQYYGHCPFHDDRSPSLSVDIEKQLWHCFGCDKGGDVIDFLKLAENLDTRGAIKVLSRRT